LPRLVARPEPPGGGFAGPRLFRLERVRRVVNRENGCWMVSIDVYYGNERTARAHAPLSAIWGFTPLTLRQYGYPVDVENEAEILRLADGEHPTVHGRFGITRYSPKEIALIGQVREAVARLSERVRGRASRPYFIFGGTIPCYRLIKRLLTIPGVNEGPHGAAVWEIGCGQGFLGSLLLADGVRYRGFDVTPVMYLWQNRLWTELIGENRIQEQAALPLDRRAAYPDELPAIHIPWWRYVREFTAAPPRIDIVVCDHALGELTDIALRHILHTAARAVEGSKLGAFVATASGALAQRNTIGIMQAFYQAGFGLAWYSNCWVALHRSSPLFHEAYTLEQVTESFNNKVMYVTEKKTKLVSEAASNLEATTTDGATTTLQEAFPIHDDVSDEIAFCADMGMYDLGGISYAVRSLSADKEHT
jgi:hypothetical protein